jgi:hypothetical protein
VLSCTILRKRKACETNLFTLYSNNNSKNIVAQYIDQSAINIGGRVWDPTLALLGTIQGPGMIAHFLSTQILSPLLRNRPREPLIALHPRSQVKVIISER